MEWNLNKRALLLLAFGLTNLVQICGQEKLASILDRLSVNGKTISIKVKDKKEVNYFDLLSKNESFRLQKDSADFDVIFVNSYKNYSAYLIVRHDAITSLDSGVGYYMRITSLIFDKEYLFCLTMKYNHGGVYCAYRGKDKILLDFQFASYIDVIQRLDENMVPLSAIGLAPHYADSDYNWEGYNYGDLLNSYYIEPYDNDKYMVEGFSLDEYLTQPSDRRENIFDINYSDLTNRFFLSKESKEYHIVRTKEKYKYSVFFHPGMFRWGDSIK